MATYGFKTLNSPFFFVKQNIILTNDRYRAIDIDLLALDELIAISKGIIYGYINGTSDSSVIIQNKINALTGTGGGGGGGGGIEVDPTISTYTKSLTSDLDISGAIKRVDGSGSGIDSDLLDGKDSTYFTNITNLSGSLDLGQF